MKKHKLGPNQTAVAAYRKAVAQAKNRRNRSLVHAHRVLEMAVKPAEDAWSAAYDLAWKKYNQAISDAGCALMRREE